MRRLLTITRPVPGKKNKKQKQQKQEVCLFAHTHKKTWYNLRLYTHTFAEKS